ncbi:unnamed protein product [Effrenium voratum]|nr:unnamed protein product [Effrenium voratum]
MAMDAEAMAKLRPSTAATVAEEEANQAADLAAAREVAIEQSLLRGQRRGAAEAVPGKVPVIDLSASNAAEEMCRAAQEFGFFVVRNHGLPEEAIDEAFGLSKKFFSQSKEEKQAQCPYARHLNSGLEYFSQVRPSTGTPDQKESLLITAAAGHMDGRWPAKPGNFEERIKDFLRKAHDLGQRILSILEPTACPQVQPGTLAKAHNLWVEGGQCNLRLLHYPPIASPETLPENYWRAGPHTDWSCITLVFQRPGNEGLECAPNPKAAKDSPWLKVDPVPGGIAVNVGDMLGRWSDGRVLSNLHRVRLPSPEECEEPKARYSMVLFMQDRIGKGFID